MNSSLHPELPRLIYGNYNSYMESHADIFVSNERELRLCIDK